MDMSHEFEWSMSERREIVAAERRLVESASAISSTSEFIADYVCETYGLVPEVVRNAANMKSLSMGSDPPKEACSPNLLYVGTVSSWFDFKAMLHLLHEIPEARLCLAGPLEVVLPENARIIHLGVVPHSSLGELAAQYDVLVMPFVLNQVVLGVDPVKLYEYLAWRRPVIACRYPEIGRFEGFISMYEGVDELVEAVRQVQKDRTYGLPTRAETAQFLAENCWPARVAQVERLMNPIAS